MFLIGIYDLIYQKNKIPYRLIIGASLLMLTHNVMAVYTAIFCCICLFFYYKEIEFATIKKITVCSILILLCTSFYWIPLLEHMLATHYEVFLPQRMYQDSILMDSKLQFSHLFFTQHYGMNFHIGIATIVGIVLVLCYRKNFSKQQQKLLWIFFLFGIVSIIMALKLFPFEYMPNILKMLQFPWRMIEFSSFFFSILAGLGFGYFMNNHPQKEIYVVIFIMICMCVSLVLERRSVENPFNEEKYLYPVPVTSSTKRVHAGCATFEYLPQKAFQNRKYIEQRTDDVIVLEGNAIINEMKKENTNLNFKVEQLQKSTKLELPYIFYLGYNVKLEKEDGTKKRLAIQESDNGFCMIEISNKDEGNIIVSYTGTIWMKISYILTSSGIAIIIWLKFHYSN